MLSVLAALLLGSVGGGAMAILPVALPLRLETDDLLPLEVTTGVLPARQSPDAPYLAATQFRVLVPEGASTLLVELHVPASVAVGVGLFLRWAVPVSEDRDYIYFSHAAAGVTRPLRLILGSGGDLPLVAGVLFIAVGGAQEVPVPFSLRLACAVRELPGEGSAAQMLSVPFLFCQIEDRFTVFIPDGWVSAPIGEADAATIAAFQTPPASDLPTIGRLEFSSMSVAHAPSLAELEQSLLAAYGRDGFAAVAQESVEIDACRGAKCWLVHQDLQTAVIITCFVDEHEAWLLTLSFSPVDLGDVYEAIFDMVTSTFRRIAMP